MDILYGIGGLIGFGIAFTILLLILVIPTLPALIIAAVARKKLQDFVNHNQKTIVAHYEPPHMLLPAEIGLLYDSKCENKEVSATLLNLKQRGIVEFTPDHTIALLDTQKYSRLEEFEKIAIRLFDKQTARADPTNSTSITFYDVNSATTSVVQIPNLNTLGSFTRAVQISLKNKGINTRSYALVFWRSVVIIACILNMIPVVLITAWGIEMNGVPQAPWTLDSFFSGLVVSLTFGIFLFPVYLIVGWIDMKIFVKIAGRYWINTKDVRRIWPELEGYRRFLETTELDRLQFASEQKEKIMNDSLPYAVVFNLDTKWESHLKKA